MKGDWCFFFSSVALFIMVLEWAEVWAAICFHLQRDAASPYSHLSCHLNWLQCSCTLRMCTNMQTHTHGLLCCSVGCIPWWIVQCHLLCRGGDSYLPTWQLFRCTHFYSPCPSFCDTAFLLLPCSTWANFIGSLIQKFFEQILFPNEIDTCVTFPVLFFFTFLCLSWQLISFLLATCHISHL